MGAAVVKWKLKTWSDWFILIALIGSGVWALWPIQGQYVGQSQALFHDETPETQGEQNKNQWGEDRFRVALTKQLRHPSPVVQKNIQLPEPVKKVVDAPKIMLIATMIGNGQASAVVRGKKNVTTKVRVGDHIDGAMISTIRSGEIEIEFEGVMMTLTLPHKDDGRGVDSDE